MEEENLSDQQSEHDISNSPAEDDARVPAAQIQPEYDISSVLPVVQPDNAAAPQEESRDDERARQLGDSGQESNVLSAMSKIWALLIYQSEDANDGDAFQKDCEQLKDTLLNRRVANARDNRVTVSKSGEDKAKIEMIRLILTWQKKILNDAIAEVNTEYKKTAETNELDRIKAAALSVYERIREIEAQSLVSQCFGHILPKTSKIRALLDKVFAVVTEQRWSKVRLRNDISPEILCKLTCLWLTELSHSTTEDPQETKPTEISSDTSLESRTAFQIINDVKGSEGVALKKLSTEYGKDCEQYTSEMADYCFLAYMFSSGVPLNTETVKERLQCSEDDIKNEKDATKKSNMSLRSVIIDHLKPIRNRSFWLHYSGHGKSDGCVTFTHVPHLQVFLRLACRLLSNVIVTLDCCFADGALYSTDLGVNVTDAPSGCTVISACARDQAAYYEKKSPRERGYSYFTKLLISALWGGLPGSCLSTLRHFYENEKLCDQVKKCQGCENYNDYKCAENKKEDKNELNWKCSHCQSLHEQANKPWVTAEKMATYVGRHLCKEHMNVVTYTHSSTSSVELPLAFFSTSRPKYLISVAFEGIECIEIIVRTHDLPTTLKNAKIQVMGGIFRLLSEGNEEVAEVVGRTKFGKSLENILPTRSSSTSDASLPGNYYASDIKQLWMEYFEKWDGIRSGAFTVLAKRQRSFDDPKYYMQRRLETCTVKRIPRAQDFLDLISFSQPEDKSDISSDESLKLAFLKLEKPVNVVVVQLLHSHMDLQSRAPKTFLPLYLDTKF